MTLPSLIYPTDLLTLTALLTLLSLFYSKSSAMKLLISVEFMMLTCIFLLTSQLLLTQLSAFKLITLIVMAVSGGVMGLVSLVYSSSTKGSDLVHLNFQMF